MPTLTCAATLKDSNQVLLSGKGIDFYFSYDGINYTFFDHANTNVNGVATVETSIVTDMWIKARFEGSPSYGASQAIGQSSQSGTVVVPKVMTFGKSVGFAYFKLGTGLWSKGNGVMSENSGLTLGLWVWDKSQARFQRGGINV
jgi:hypothetical protein